MSLDELQTRTKPQQEPQQGCIAAAGALGGVLLLLLQGTFDIVLLQGTLDISTASPNV